MTEPTDAEILELASHYWECLDETERETEIELVRAALAKWGTPPAVAGEPVALLVRKNSWRDGHWEAAPPNSPSYGKAWANKRMYVYATPQPTQAQAGAVPMYRLLQSGVDRIEAADEFLSDDTTTWAIDPNGIFLGSIYGGHVLRPARRRIKGGQHG